MAAYSETTATLGGSFDRKLRHNPVVPVTRQKLILDEDMFEVSFLRCMVCQNRYNAHDRAPRLLPCHHAFCMECILSFYQKEAEYRASMAVMPSNTMAFAVSISCPHCKANFITTEDGLRQLTTDHRIVQLLDFVGQTDKQTVVYCEKHAAQPLNFFCEKCADSICRDCTVLDHKTCSQEKLVIDLKGAVEKYRPAIADGKNNLSGEVTALQEKKKECEQALESCAKGDDEVSKQIKETFAKLRKALDDREKELLDMANEGQGNKQQVIEDKLKAISTKQSELSSIIDNLDKVSSNTTVEELFNMYRQIRDYKTEPGLEKQETESKDSSVMTFNARDETMMTGRIKNFGDIQTSTRQSNGYGSGSTYSTSSYSTGSAYVGSRYGGYSTGSSYSSRYTPTRSYKY